MSKLYVGQVLYQPPLRHRMSGVEHEVLKISRVWATLSNNYRCKVESLELDTGGYSPIQLYLSKEAYEAKMLLDSEWRQFRQDIYNKKMPDGMTFDMIKQARELLKVSA